MKRKGSPLCYLPCPWEQAASCCSQTASLPGHGGLTGNGGSSSSWHGDLRELHALLPSACSLGLADCKKGALFQPPQPLLPPSPFFVWAAIANLPDSGQEQGTAKQESCMDLSPGHLWYSWLAVALKSTRSSRNGNTTGQLAAFVHCTRTFGATQFCINIRELPYSTLQLCKDIFILYLEKLN